MEEELERIQDIQTLLDPSVIDVAVQIVQLDAITSIVLIFLFSMLGWASFSVMRLSYRHIDWDSSSPGKYGLMFMFSVWGFVASVAIILIQVFDTWTWMALLNPRIAAIHYLLEKIGGS
jgi:hypothetical protein